MNLSLREKYPYLELFLSAFSHIWTEYGEILCISSHSDTLYLSVFSPNAGKCGPENLRIRTLFTQCVTRGFELVTRGFEIVTRGFELVTCGFELVTRGFELVTRGFELVTRGFELVTRGFEFVTRGFELAHLNFNSCF